MADVPLHELVDTWNDAGTTFQAIQMNVTDTASAAGSLLLDLQVASASKFSVTKTGQLLIGANATAYDNPAISLIRSIDNSLAISSHGFVDESQIDSGRSYAAFDVQVDILDGEDYSIRHFAGFQSNGIYANSGNLGNWYGYTATFTNNGGIVSNYYGACVNTPAGTGEISNIYGFYCAPISGGTSKNYQYFAAGTTGKSFFGGSVLINDSDDTPDGRCVAKVLASGSKAFIAKNTAGKEIFTVWSDGGEDGQLHLGDAAGTAKIVLDAGAASKILGGPLGIGLTPTANMAGISVEAGLVTIKETTTPTADANYGKIYTKSDNKLYFQDGDGTEHELAYAA